MFLHWWVPLRLMVASVIDVGWPRRRMRWMYDMSRRVRVRRRMVTVGRTRVGMRRRRLILARRRRGMLVRQLTGGR